MNRTRQVVGLVGCVVAAAGTLGTLAATSGAASQTAAAPTAAETATLSAGEVSLLSSGQAINVVMDPTTGDINSVTAASSSGATVDTTDITNHSICDTGDGCYKTNDPPLADQGFSGAGTFDGSWADRSGYSSGKWTVSACWSGGCGVTISPGSTVNFTSDVTGTSFTIDSGS
jgi:hypothetical protein